MRYTAVTCDPDDFTREAGWSLRAQKYGRDIELLVAIVSFLPPEFLSVSFLFQSDLLPLSMSTY